MIKKLFLLTFILFPVVLFSQNLDIRILRSLNSPEARSSDKFFRIVSNSNVYLVTGIPIALGAIGLAKDDDHLFRNACVMLTTVTLNSGINLAVKYAVNRDRPFITYPDITQKSAVGSPSFPSGHTSSAFALATSLSISYPKWYVIVSSYSWAGTVAFSRMDLGVHYPSDVLAGALIGSGSAWLTHYVNKKLLLRTKRFP